MAPWQELFLLALVAGLTMPLGALLAGQERLLPAWIDTELRHSVLAFGGGALLSAIALVLVPEGSAVLSPVAVAVCFLGGGVAFLGLDLFLARHQTPAGQLAAMLSDFIPEALALGAAFASGSGSAALLAGLIALQNLPEGFNASRELTAGSSLTNRRIVGLFSLLALLGPAAALAGYFWLAKAEVTVGAIMVFAAGGILYLVFQDIAPQAKLKRHWGPPLGAVAGFLLGLMGQMLVEG